MSNRVPRTIAYLAECNVPRTSGGATNSALPARFGLRLYSPGASPDAPRGAACGYQWTQGNNPEPSSPG